MQEEKTKRKLKITQKAIKDRILMTCSPATESEKGAC
jgi:flagellar basal body-associated protein FliL